MATVTVSGGGKVETADVTIRGSIEIETTHCERTIDDKVSCDALLRGSVFDVGPFEVFDTKVALLNVRSGASPSEARVAGKTLTIPSYSGEGEARLANGKFDVLELTSGVILGDWEPAADNFQVVIAIEGDLDDDIAVRLDGTVGGQFVNISPIAIAESRSADPAFQANPVPGALQATTSDSTDIECTDPDGTPALLDATLSFDLDEDQDELKYVWREIGSGRENFLSQEPTFETAALPLGPHAFELSVYDERGQLGTDLAEFEIVDTKPPTIVVSAPACLWPPNHRFVPLRLGEDLVVQADDECAGDVSGSARIVGATSNEPNDGTGDGSTQPDVILTDDNLCLRAERAGTGDQREYTVTIAVDDGHGNEAIQAVQIVVPHDMSEPTDCVRPKGVPRCFSASSSAPAQ